MQGTTPKDTGGPLRGIQDMGPEELLREGTQHFRAREYALARAYLERYIGVAPQDARACHMLARVYYHENANLDGAVELITRAVRIMPEETSRFLLTLAEIYIHQGDYAGAEVVLGEAARLDPGKDPKHAYAIDFYLNMVRRKNRSRPGAARGPAEEPRYYSAGRDARYNRKGRHFFILPSIVLHILGLLLVGYLSGMSLPARERFEEDFTFVEVGAMPEEYVAEQGETGAPETARADAPSRAQPGPQAPARRAEGTGSVQSPLDIPAEGPRSLAGEKSAAALEGETGVDDSAAAPGASEKSADISGRASAPDVADVRFSPGELGLSAEGGASSGRSERGAKVLADRRGSPSAEIRGGAGAGGGSAERAGRLGGGKAAASLGGGPAGGDAPSGPSGGEKSLALDRPASSGAGAGLPDAGLSRSGADAIYISSSGAKDATGAGSPGGETFKSVEKGGARASAQGQKGGFGQAGSAAGPFGGPGPVSGKKGLGGLLSEGGGGGEGLPAPAAGTGRKGMVASSRAGRGFAGEGPELSPRKLGISGGTGEGTDASAGPGRARPGGPSGIEDKRSTGPASAGGAGAGAAGAEFGTGRGYSPAAGAGKGYSGGALSGGTSGESGLSGAVSGEKAGALPGRRAGAGAGVATAPEPGPRKPGGLEGLLAGLVKAVTGGREGGEGGGGGVRLGSGEKTGTAAPSGAGVAGAPGGTGTREPGAGEKRDADGALGAQAGRDKYASAAATKPAPIAPEKLSGVRVASKGGAKTGLGPTVRILSPAPGDTSELSQVVKGIVSDARLVKATLTVNNDSRVVSVADGRFEAAVALADGRNVITVMAFDRDGNAGKDSVTVYYSAGRASMPINITEPRDGQVYDVSQTSIVKVRGTVGDTRVKRARMVLNGRPKDIVVKDGRFTQDVALTQEKNTVVVEAADPDGGVSVSGTVGFGTMNVRPKDIMIILTWDRPNADFDLHVIGPLGGHTSYKSPNIYEARGAIEGGQLELDAKGNFGPEVFTMERSEKGVYTIKSNYYYSGGDGDAHATVTVILYGDNPARRIVRVFGPHLQVDTKTGEDMWDVAKFRMPDGIFLED